MDNLYIMRAHCPFNFTLLLYILLLVLFFFHLIDPFSFWRLKKCTFVNVQCNIKRVSFCNQNVCFSRSTASLIKASNCDNLFGDYLYVNFKTAFFCSSVAVKTFWFGRSVTENALPHCCLYCSNVKLKQDWF